MMKTRAQPAAGSTRVRWRQLQVLVAAGPDKGRSALLEQGPLTVGSGPSCEFILRDDTVSSRHCELSARAEGVAIRDLGSTNGVTINGVRILDAVAAVGDRIALGQSKLTLKSVTEADVELSSAERFGSLYGRSGVMRALFAQLEALGHSLAPLLIEGETGTGKDVTAEAVHRASGRAQGPFVVFDCGAVAANLLEAELFGYEKGAFTGASSTREGLAEAANGGTLVLDEMGELPLELQPKLLRLVERKEIRRVGSNSPKTVDVRIIACTHRSLRAEVKAGRFREDLYYRLSALRVRLPALRERLEDLPGLVDQLLSDQHSTRTFDQLPDGDQSMLLSHRWPGNIRELRNAVDRLLAFPINSSKALLEEEMGTHSGTTGPDLPLELVALSVAREQSQDAFERRYLKDLMHRSAGSISEGARLAGISRQFLQRIMRKHGMR